MKNKRKRAKPVSFGRRKVKSERKSPSSSRSLLFFARIFLGGRIHLAGGELDQVESMWERTRHGAKPADFSALPLTAPGSPRMQNRKYSTVTNTPNTIMRHTHRRSYNGASVI